jgi:threonylcarbamoyladenosine tRNA methylthiotransferase MtaB
VLTGTCIGSFGHDLSPQSSLAECAAAVAAVPGIARVRISSIEPWQVTDALVALVAENPVLCPHFHLPLQSADDSVRRRMRRPGTSARFADLVAGIRARLPEAGITTDVIVGFPGESDAASAACTSSATPHAPSLPRRSCPTRCQRRWPRPAAAS